MDASGHARTILMAAVCVLAAQGFASAQRQDSELFDRFNLAFEGSLVALDTNLRLDSKTLGVGTSLDFESDGGLASSEGVASLSFEWQFGYRHGLRGWWQNVDRDQTTQILEEIRFGDQVYPIDTLVTFAFDEEEYGLGYNYYFMRKPRLALGAGGGVRTLKIGSGLTAFDQSIDEEGDFTGPLPFGTFQVRWLPGERWRFVSEFGVFYVEIGEYSGGQLILDGYIEYLAWKHFSFGAGWRAGYVNVEVDTSDFLGKARIDSGAFRGYARIRF